MYIVFYKKIKKVVLLKIFTQFQAQIAVVAGESRRLTQIL